MIRKAKLKKILFPLLSIVILIIGGYAYKNLGINPLHKIGEPVDSLNHVIVYYNGRVGNVTERNTTADGYNLGLNYQCVEFVKRYYYKHLHHKMPNSYGNAKDFFNRKLTDVTFNKERGLMQYTNTSGSKPKVNDLIVFDASVWNSYGHVAIIARVTETAVEIIQQNPGPFGNSRETYALDYSGGKWTIENARVLGWLRKE